MWIHGRLLVLKGLLDCPVKDLPEEARVEEEAVQRFKSDRVRPAWREGGWEVLRRGWRGGN